MDGGGIVPLLGPLGKEKVGLQDFLQVQITLLGEGWKIRKPLVFQHRGDVYSECGERILICVEGHERRLQARDHGFYVGRYCPVTVMDQGEVVEVLKAKVVRLFVKPSGR